MRDTIGKETYEEVEERLYFAKDAGEPIFEALDVKKVADADSA